MTEQPDRRPWELMDAIAETRDADRLEAYVDSLAPSEAARALAHLSTEEQNRVLETLDPEEAADLLGVLPTAQAADLVEQLPASMAAPILLAMPSDDQADLVVEMEDDDAEAMLAVLDPEDASEIRALARYDDDVAGGLMVTELLRVRADATCAEVIGQLRREADKVSHQIQYVYVVDASERLVGVLAMRDLLLAGDDAPAGTIMIPEPLTVGDKTPLDDMIDIFEHRGYLALPVVDVEGQLLGLVLRGSATEAALERAGADHLKSQGIVGGEELRTMPLLQRSGRRLSWLSINIVLNVIAASVIAFFEDTLSAVIALAFFLPIISDMSGCSGNQAVAVSIRELSLGLVKPFEVVYVWLKEIGIGLINGLVLGLLIGGVAWAWRGNPWLGFVVGGALTLNTMIAVSIGGAVPLLLKRMKVDPAIASGPVLTTVTDMFGFFLVLGLATLMLPMLVA